MKLFFRLLHFTQMLVPGFAQSLPFFPTYSKTAPRILGMQIYMIHICYLLPLLMSYPSLVVLLLKQEQERCLLIIILCVPHQGATLQTKLIRLRLRQGVQEDRPRDQEA